MLLNNNLFVFEDKHAFHETTPFGSSFTFFSQNFVEQPVHLNVRPMFENKHSTYCLTRA
jgi:hypothetical protein